MLEGSQPTWGRPADDLLARIRATPAARVQPRVAGDSSGPMSCRRDLFMVPNPLDATSVASDWPGEHLVHLRYGRDTGVTNNAAQTFSMAALTLTHVRL